MTIDQLKRINELELTRKELAPIVSSLSRQLKRRIKRLSASGIPSPTLQLEKTILRNLDGTETDLLDYTVRGRNRAQLLHDFRELTRIADYSTSSIRGTKKFMKDFEERTGMKYGSEAASAIFSEFNRQREQDPWFFQNKLDSERILKEIKEKYENDDTYRNDLIDQLKRR